MNGGGVLTFDVGGDAVLEVAHHGPVLLPRRHAVRLTLERTQAACTQDRHRSCYSNSSRAAEQQY